MSKPALRHMMLNDDVLAGEFETILGYRTSHAGIVLPGGVPGNAITTIGGDAITTIGGDVITTV